MQHFGTAEVAPRTPIVPCQEAHGTRLTPGSGVGCSSIVNVEVEDENVEPGSRLQAEGVYW